VKIAPQLERAGSTRHSSLITRHSVNVHIEELVLHGFATGDCRRIAQALEQELARLMGEGTLGWRQNPPVIERVNAGAFKVEAAAKPQATGTEIARAVFRSLRQRASASASVTRARVAIGGR